MYSHYETPEALRHDLRTFVDDAKSLIDATTGIADEKVTEARRRLESALVNCRDRLETVRSRALDGLATADECVRRNPYPSVAVALGVGALFGLLASSRRH